MVDVHLRGLMEIRSGQANVKLSLSKNEPNNSKNLSTNSATLESLKGVAEQFEAIFLEQLLRQARESKLSDGLFEY